MSIACWLRAGLIFPKHISFSNIFSKKKYTYLRKPKPRCFSVRLRSAPKQQRSTLCCADLDGRCGAGDASGQAPGTEDRIPVREGVFRPYVKVAGRGPCLRPAQKKKENGRRKGTCTSYNTCSGNPHCFHGPAKPFSFLLFFLGRDNGRRDSGGGKQTEPLMRNR